MNHDYITLAEAAKRLPGRPHVSTLHRWRTRGLHGVKLRTTKIGGRRFVTIEDLEEFIDQVTAAADKTPPAAPHRRARWKQIAAAEAELARAGISAPRNETHGDGT